MICTSFTSCFGLRYVPGGIVTLFIEVIVHMSTASLCRDVGVAIAFLLPMAGLAQEKAGAPVQVKTQTAAGHPQTVVETPKTRQERASQHLTDPLNTKKGSGDPRRRDAYGTPVPEPLHGQGTNVSSDAVRAADPKK